LVTLFEPAVKIGVLVVQQADQLAQGWGIGRRDHVAPKVPDV